MKTLLKKPFKLIVAIITIVILIFLGIIIFRQQFSNQTNTPPKELSEKELRADLNKEVKTVTSINSIIQNYIKRTYPGARDIKIDQELIGRGYGIVNTTFTLNNETSIRKIYIEEKNSSWNVIYDDTDTISCSKAQEISGANSILTSFCI